MRKSHELVDAFTGFVIGLLALALTALFIAALATGGF